jgi:hypothetical protein
MTKMTLASINGTNNKLIMSFGNKHEFKHFKIISNFVDRFKILQSIYVTLFICN